MPIASKKSRIILIIIGSNTFFTTILIGVSTRVSDYLSEMERWTGRVALVTGASSGMGKGIAEALVKEGMIIVGCVRR